MKLFTLSNINAFSYLAKKFNKTKLKKFTQLKALKTLGFNNLIIKKLKKILIGN